MAACVWLRRVEGTEQGVFGGILDLGNSEVGAGLRRSPSGLGEWAEIHPVAGVFVLWGCAMVSRTIHIPKP